jgi:hypothetical protein
VTIINSIISDHGLIQASDSNLTQPGSSQATPGQKVFHLGFSDGALALAGNYSVGIQLMDTWMPSCISAYASTPSPTQEGFANYLIGRLDTDLTSSQKTYPTMFQIVTSATAAACIQRCISCAIRLSTVRQVHTRCCRRSKSRKTSGLGTT